MNSNQTMVKMVFDRWNALVKNFSASLDALSDEQLEHEIAPGRNRGIYLVGHLVAVHDDMIRLLDFGDKLYPELFEAFIKSPDKTVPGIPSAQELRTAWNTMNETLSTKFGEMKTDDWFAKHTAVSEEEFAKEPHRNKLNIVLTRASHLAYHHGQFVLIR